MARAVYSTRFISQSVGTSTITSYVVPAGFVAVIVDVTCLFLAGNDGNLGLQINESGPYIANFSSEEGQLTTPHWQGRAVLNAGDELLSTLDTASYASTIVSGYLLSAA